MGQSKGDQRFRLALFFVATGLLALLIAPFAGAFFAATVLAVVLEPLQRRLTKRLGQRPRTSAALLSALAVLTVVVPLTVLTVLVADQVYDAARWAQETASEGGIEGLVDPLPEAVRPGARWVLKHVPALAQGDPGTDAPGQIVEPVDSKVVGRAVGLGIGVMPRLFSFLLQFSVLIICLFFLLAGGGHLIDYLVELSPLPDEDTESALRRFRDVTTTMFMSTVAAAVIQTLVATLGYVAADVPLMGVAILATFLLAFVPAIGASGVCMLMGAIVWMRGEAAWGISLLLWGAVVVGLTDNFVKPLLAKEGTRLPTSIVFFAMLCGLAVFGPMGLVAGPLVVVFFQVSAELLRGRHPG